MNIWPRFTSVLLLVAISSNAMAEWVKFGHSARGVEYADPATIRKVGHVVKIWLLTDLEMANTTTPKPYMSIKSQHEYDCKEELGRMIYASFFSENMGGGDVLHADRHSENWQPMVPGTIGEVFFKFACEKRPKWIEVGSDGSVTTYVDPASIHKDGNRVKMWNLYDFKTARDAGSDKFKSTKMLIEYDCKENQYRRLADSFHYGNMGIGVVLLASDNPESWEPVIPETIVDSFKKFACNK